MNNSCLTVFVKDDSKYNTMLDYMMADVKEDFISIEEKRNPSRIVHLLKKNKVQSVTKGSLNFLFASSYELYNVLKKETKRYKKVVVLFTNSSFLYTRYPEKVLLNYKKEWENIHYVLFYIDIVNHPVSYHANCLRDKEIFDLVYTVDKDDAEKYNFRLWMTPYSENSDMKKIQSEKDLFFCGVTKGRTDILVQILEAAKENDIECNMRIKCEENEKEILNNYAGMIELMNDYESYDELLKKTLHSNCVLEIVQEGQAALTLRPYESVVYNRKLLTNNRSILSFPYYNPAYMQYFEKPEQIDWEWVKERKEISYDYNGEFSPLHLMCDINNNIKG